MSKYLAEEFVKTFVDSYSILRICGIYGIDGPSHLNLNKAITDAVRYKKPPVLYGSGNSRRNYICVMDVVRWIMHLIKKHEGSRILTAGNTQETLYLASPEIMTIEQYLQASIDVVLPDKKIERKEGRESADMIVRPSDAPFRPVTFREYLSLIN